MCLAAFALEAHPRFPLVIAANRDEFFARPAAPMDWWPGVGVDVLAGRDLSAGGTWFGLTRAGRLALLTNVREPGRQIADAPSRGALVPNWLGSNDDALAFAERLASGYNGFNLITADLRRKTKTWHWLSNRSPGPVLLKPGLHAVSNAALDTPWPKTLGLRAAMRESIAAARSVDDLAASLLDALADRGVAADDALPDTGVGLARERELSARFVRMADPAQPDLALYGTRCSTVLICDGRDAWVTERSVAADGQGLPARAYRLPNWPGVA